MKIAGNGSLKPFTSIEDSKESIWRPKAFLQPRYRLHLTAIGHLAHLKSL